MIGRIINRVLHRLVRGTLEHPIRFVIVVVVLLGAAAFLVLRAGMPTLALSLPSAPSFRVGSSAPSATENYMKGTETFNADLVWNSLSDDAQNRYRSRGGSMQQLQQQMDQAKQAGAELDQVTYIGGQSFPDGSSMQFYTVLTKGPQAQSTAEPVPYVFTLDSSGKIVRVQ
jgi:hypothetical protein